MSPLPLLRWEQEEDVGGYHSFIFLCMWRGTAIVRRKKEKKGAGEVLFGDKRRKPLALSSTFFKKSGSQVSQEPTFHGDGLM